MEKSKSWYKRYGLRADPKPSKGYKFLCDLPSGSLFGISNINYQGILLQVTEGGCYVVRKNAPKYSKMGELLGKEDRKEYIGRRTQVDDWGEIINTDRFAKRRKAFKDNKSDSVGARKDKRLIRMAKKGRKNN